MEVVATTKNIRMSPLKGRDLARKVQGLKVGEALKITQFSARKAAFHLGKTIKSAVANAQHNNNADPDTLWVRQAVIDDGTRMRRFWPRARGSASPIERRLCRVKVVVSDQAPDGRRK